MRILALVLLAFVIKTANAQQTHDPYGLVVSDAELRFMSGMHSLGVSLELGRGAPADHQRAAEAYRKAAVLGYPFSQNNLARLYEIGLGVPKDRVVAYAWYLLAASSGEPLLIENRNRSADALMPDEITNAETLARTLRKHLPVLQR